MKFFKKILLVLLLAFIVIQFFRPAKNIAAGPEAYAKDISTIHAVPADVQTILKKACNDCHSNNTVYPWYNNIQPVAWWLANHVKEGKRELNFSEFANYSPRRQYIKLDEVNKLVKNGEMPLSSYTWIHKDAKLTDAEKLTIANWVTTIRDSMAAIYPKDSLERRRPAAPKQE
ncbi:MAG: heme-binding domain-containing protein [Ferruginibacter sp.]